VTAQEPGQSTAVGPGSLDAERADSAELVGQSEQLGVSIRPRGDGELAESAAEAVERDRDVFVLVGVDTDDDVATAECDAGHVVGLLAGVNDARRSGGKDRTATGPGPIRLL